MDSLIIYNTFFCNNTIFAIQFKRRYYIVFTSKYVQIELLSSTQHYNNIYILINNIL